jgi:hypothetical protein
MRVEGQILPRQLPPEQRSVLGEEEHASIETDAIRDFGDRASE